MGKGMLAHHLDRLPKAEVVPKCIHMLNSTRLEVGGCAMITCLTDFKQTLDHTMASDVYY